MNKTEINVRGEEFTEGYIQVIWQSVVGLVGVLLIVYGTLAGVYYYIKIKHKPKRYTI